LGIFHHSNCVVVEWIFAGVAAWINWQRRRQQQVSHK